MSVIPFVFIWKGDWLRQKSKFCQYLAERERKEEEEEQERRQEGLNAGREELARQKEVKEKHGAVDESAARDGKEEDMV
jgi:hypothetical protein